MTVGAVVSTARAIWLADFTADREFHPALKFMQSKYSLNIHKSK